MPRQLDSVWKHFEKVVQIGKTGCRAKCKRCSKDIQGIVARMKYHMEICGLQLQAEEQAVDVATPEDVADEMPQRVAMPPSSNPMQSPMRKRPRLIESYVQKTSSSEKENLDVQVARFFFANNTPFRTDDHEEFHKLLHMLRPGYQPPSRKDI